MQISEHSKELLVQSGRTLQDTCYTIAAESGWWTDLDTMQDIRVWEKKHVQHWVGAKLALVHSEISEALEGYRKQLSDDKLPHRPMVEVELADAIIRIFDLAGGMGWDVPGAIAEKLQYNLSREDHKLDNRAQAGGKSF